MGPVRSKLSGSFRRTQPIFSDKPPALGRVAAAVSLPFPVGRWSRGLVRGELDSMWGPDAPAFYEPSLGGPFRVAQFADTRLARAFGSWFERAIMGKFPPYAVLKSLSARLSGEDDDKLQPALMTIAPDTRVLVAIVEELADGNVTVFLPMAPTPAVGHLQIVSAKKLERLECSMSDALGWPLNWGVGTEAILGRKTP